MAKIRGANLSEQKRTVNECADACEYYYRVLEAKRRDEEWVEDIPCDMNIYHSERCETEHLRGKYDKNANILRSKDEVLAAIKRRLK